ENTLTTAAANQPQVAQSNTIVNTQAPITTTVIEAPITQNIIEKQNIEIHNKDVILEVHEQKIIELEKQPVYSHIVQDQLVEKSTVPVTYETVGSNSLDQSKIQQLTSQPQVVSTIETGAIAHRQEQPITQVTNQEFIERHIQPVITEVREQNVIQEVEHPIVRKYVESPIVRQVETNKSRHYTQDSGQFENMNVKWNLKDFDVDLHKRTNSLSHAHLVAPGAPISTTPQDGLILPSAVQPVLRQASPMHSQDALEVISCAGKDSLWGLSRRNEIYKLVQTSSGAEWQFHPTNGLLLKDISAAPRGILFGIGLNDGYLYRINDTKIELVLKDDFTRITNVSAQSRRKIYALGEDGRVLFLHLKLVGTNKNATYETIGGQLKKIAVGGKHAFRRTELWGIGFDNRAYRYVAPRWIPHEAFLIDISVSDDNAVYGVRIEDGRLVKWSGDSTFTLQERINTSSVPNHQHSVLTNVTAYKESRNVYAVERGTGNILKME
ncbi:pheT, partial [Acrasis kona]